MRKVVYLAMLPLLAGAAYMASAVTSGAQGSYTIGVSNTVQGNGWREEMICAIKAQALASGKVAKLNIAHRNTDAAGQLLRRMHHPLAPSRPISRTSQPPASVWVEAISAVSS